MSKTMYKVSLSVTEGENSERHDHNMVYRSKLKNVVNADKGIFEFIPYLRSYQETINAFAKPYIDLHAEKRRKDFEAATRRFERGLIKTRPQEKDYRPYDYDFFTYLANLDYRNPKTKKREKSKPYRSLIIAIGDQQDRLNGRIVDEQVIGIGHDLLNAFRNQFKNFLLLGFVLHLDEAGGYHIHISFLPVYFGATKGLSFGTGYDRALREGGIAEERSIFSGEAEGKTCFNGFRNWFYHNMEEILPRYGLLFDFGVTARKCPWIPSDRRVTQEVWKELQDYQILANKLVNEARQTLKEETFTEKDILTVAAANNELNNLLAKIQGRSKLFGKDEYRLDAKTYEGIWEAFEKERELTQLLLFKAERFFKRLQDAERENEQLQYDLKARDRDCAILEAQLRQQGRDVQLPDLYRAER